MAATSYDVFGIRTWRRARIGRVRRSYPVNSFLTVFVCFALLPAGAATGAALDLPMAVTQLPANEATGALKARAGGMLRADYGEGARLVLVAADGTRRVLSEGFHSASDAAVSFDGDRLLFAGKRSAGDDWNIYEMGVDGSGVRQITRGLGDCRSPGYQSSLYTLKPVGVPSVPEYHLTFVAGVGTLDEYGGSEARGLYSCKFDGSTVRQLTYNLSSDWDPCILGDGRLVFASWQRSRLERGVEGTIGLFGLNIDGSDFAGFATGQGKRIQQMPCVTARGLVVFVEAETVGWDGAGSLGSVTLRRPLHSYRRLTEGGAGLFHSPSPLPDGRVLVSRRSNDGWETHGVFVFDPDGGRIESVFDDPEWHDIQAKAIYARREPDGRASAVPEDVDEAARTGRFYCLDVYTSDLGPSWVEPGALKRLRVLEGVGVESGREAQATGIPPVVQRRILGEIPIEEDGSFNIEIPSNTPIELQVLDGDGMALRSCGWIWVKDHARQGCIGCHEDPELTPENLMVDAVKRASTKLTPAAGERRTVDFRRDVMPIVAGRCAACHGDAGGLTLTDGGEGAGSFNRTYESLLAAGDELGRGKYVHPGKARTSPLIWHLYGRNTSRLWDEADRAGTARVMPPDGAPALTADEKRTFVEWVDMGALWDGIPAVAARKQEEQGGGQ
jgi:hydrazine synthase alpha subunit-like protein